MRRRTKTPTVNATRMVKLSKYPSTAGIFLELAGFSYANGERGLLTSQQSNAQKIAATEKSCEPAGALTVTWSPILQPRIALPRGEMSEILLRSGLASFAATTW